MKVFISWSGEMSKELGEALRTWIPAVIQQVKPYFTPNDIEKGARWGTDISGELNESKVGIICLTKENMEKPWIMFEAGALSKQLDSSYVCPILFNLDNADLKGPLVQFQATPFNKTEIKKLVSTINKLLGDNKLEDNVLNSVFEMWWPKLDEQIKNIFSKYQGEEGKPESTRDQRDILEEILALTRMSAKRSGGKSKKPEIAPAAYTYLARNYVEIHKLTTELAPDSELYSKVIDLLGVVEYLSRRGGKDSDEYDDVIMLMLNKLDEQYEDKHSSN